VLDSVTVTAGEFDPVRAFYEAALGALGLVRLDELVDEEEDEPAVEAVAWGPAGGRSVVWVVAGAVPTTGLHLRLAAGSRAQVETFHAAGVAAGGVTYAAPRRWPIYRRGEFNAILRDPQGNLVEAVAPE
jgi:catechol 2,3-dioxygenase-like lactoylglutathione lyase family enzyme